MIKETKKQKTIMESLFIDEISGVDRPAQEGARALLIKRDDSGDLLKSFGLKLTSDKKGHSHLVDSNEEGGTTTHNTSKGAEFPHSHPWVRTTDGILVIGAAEGHGHSVIEKRFEPEDDGFDIPSKQRLDMAKTGEALPDGSYPIATVADLGNAVKAFDRAVNKGLVEKHIKRRARAIGAEEELLALKGELQKEQKTMDKKVKTVEAVEKELQEAQDKLAIAETFGKMNDAEKTHYAGLDPKGQTAFLEMDVDGRKNLIAKSAGENPVVYTSTDGDEFLKNDDPRLIKAAKRADNADRVAKEEREKREDQDLAKRAESELDKLPGEPDVKKALLKAVDGIGDEKVREGVTALLKAGNSGLEKAFVKVGSRGEGESDLNTEYEKISQEYAKENDVTIEIARGDVLTKSVKGRELAQRMEAERQA